MFRPSDCLQIFSTIYSVLLQSFKDTSEVLRLPPRCILHSTTGDMRHDRGQKSPIYIMISGSLYNPRSCVCQDVFSQKWTIRGLSARP